MGGPRAGADTQSLGTSTSSAGSAERLSLPGRRCLGPLAVYLLAGAALFTVYLRLSETSAPNSDSANILLMGWDLLHGHLLLHGWYMSDVSFFPTELPQYALLESFLGLHMQTAHVAAAMTYTLTFLLAVLLARRGSTGRAALIRTLIAAGIMLAPQLGVGVFSLDLSVGHIGTSVPLLLTWLLLDSIGRGGDPPRPPRSWGNPSPQTLLGGDKSPQIILGGDLSHQTPLGSNKSSHAPLTGDIFPQTALEGDISPRTPLVPVLTAVLLAWALVADPIVYVVGIGPLGVVAAARVIRGFVGGSGHWTGRIGAQWYDLSLGAAAVAAAGLAWVVDNVLSDLGGYTVNRLPFYLTSWHGLHNNVPAVWKVLGVFGADYTRLSGVQFALAFLHMASVLVVLWALARVGRRFFRVSLVDQVLAVAIVLNVGLYLLTNASDEASNEVAIIVPFSAVLAARMLVRTAQRGTAQDGGPGSASSGLARRIRLAGFAAGILVLVGYTAGLGYEISQPPALSPNAGLASWLLDHDLTYGLSGYWTSSSVTVDSDNRVQVRALKQYSMERDLWMSTVSWYDPKLHYANFIVLDSRPGLMSHWEPRALVRKYFGRPARIFHTGPYTVLVWDRNLLLSIPR